MRVIPPTQHPILFFGEYHGSAQSPAFFGDAVATVSEFKPVLVILEQSQTEARLVSKYVNGRMSMAGIVSLGRVALGIERSAASGRRAAQYCNGEVALSFSTATGKWPRDPHRGYQRR